MFPPDRETGSVLFLILIAVVLFAALSYAVSQTTRGGSIDPGEEKAELLAAEIINYATAIQTAITRLQVSNGCEDTEISFENPIGVGYANPNAPPDKSCHVFDVNGAGMNWRKFAEDFEGEHASATLRFTGQIKIVDIGLDKAELVLLVVDLNKAICRSLNKAFGFAPDPASDSASQLGFIGAYNDATNGKIGDFGASMYAGHQNFCYDQSGRLKYVHVLIAR